MAEENLRAQHSIGIAIARGAFAGGVVFAGLALIDAVSASPLLSATALLATVAAGYLAGGVCGAVGSALFTALERVPKLVAFASWAATGTAAAIVLATQLGVVGQLHGASPREARLAAIACALAATAIAVPAMLVQATHPDATGWAARSRRRGTVVAAAFVTLSVAAAAVDRMAYPYAYPSAHTMLRIVSLWVATLALAARPIAGPHLRLRWACASLGAATALTAFAPLRMGSLHTALAGPFSGFVVRFVRAASDFDRDGYSAWLAGGDCAPFDGAVHPMATEVAMNGIDDDCLFGDAPAATPSRDDGEPSIPASAAPMNVALITVDSLRADRFGPRPGHRVVMPELTRWSEGALRFDHAYSSGCWTSVAVPSLLRGVYPRRMEWTRLFETNKFRLLRAPLSDLRKGEVPRKAFALPLGETPRPLAYWLRRRGMITLAVLDDGYAEYFDRSVGAVTDFDRVFDADSLPAARHHDAGVTDEAIRLLKEHEPAKPFFLWVHYFGPHLPSTRHADIPNYGSGVVAGYDHEVTYADREIARLVRTLEGMDRPTAIILTADHGEEIERGSRYHGLSTRPATLRIPLVLKTPDGVNGNVSATASLVDVMPTVLALTETPAPHGLDGLDLRSLPDARVVHASCWRLDATGGVILDEIAAARGEDSLSFNLLDWDAWLPAHANSPIRPPELAPDLALAAGRYVTSGGPLMLQD